MQVSKKVLAVIIAFSVAVTLLGVACYMDWGGIGTVLAGAGGPVAQGFYNIFNAPLLWGSQNGWPALAAVYCGIVAIVVGFAYVVVHYDVPAKLKGAASSQPDLSPSLSSLPKEPEEPERAPAPVSPTPSE